MGKLREVREVREKLRDKCPTSYGKRLLSLNFPNDRRQLKKKSTEHTEYTEKDFRRMTNLRLQPSDLRLQTSFSLKIILKILVKMSSRKAIHNKILPKSEVLERILVKDSR